MNKHVHLEFVAFEDIIIMMECDKIVWFKVTRVRWMMMMMEGGMIDTNRYDGVKFPISMCVRELELRSQRMWGREVKMDQRGVLRGRWVGRRLHLVRRSVCCCWGHEGNESVMMNEMKWWWKGNWGWYYCQRCLEEGRWADCDLRTWIKGGKEWGIMRREWKEEMKEDFWDWWRLIDGVIPMSLNRVSLWCGMEMRMKRDWRRDLRRVRSLKASEGIEVSLLELK